MAQQRRSNRPKIRTYTQDSKRMDPFGESRRDVVLGHNPATEVLEAEIAEMNAAAEGIEDTNEKAIAVDAIAKKFATDSAQLEANLDAQMNFLDTLERGHNRGLSLVAEVMSKQLRMKVLRSDIDVLYGLPADTNARTLIVMPANSAAPTTEEMALSAEFTKHKPVAILPGLKHVQVPQSYPDGKGGEVTHMVYRMVAVVTIISPRRGGGGFETNSHWCHLNLEEAAQNGGVGSDLVVWRRKKLVFACYNPDRAVAQAYSQVMATWSDDERGGYKAIHAQTGLPMYGESPFGHGSEKLASFESVAQLTAERGFFRASIFPPGVMQLPAPPAIPVEKAEVDDDLDLDYGQVRMNGVVFRARPALGYRHDEEFTLDQLEKRRLDRRFIKETLMGKRYQMRSGDANAWISRNARGLQEKARYELLDECVDELTVVEPPVEEPRSEQHKGTRIPKSRRHQPVLVVPAAPGKSLVPPAVDALFAPPAEEPEPASEVEPVVDTDPNTDDSPKEPAGESKQPEAGDSAEEPPAEAVAADAS